VLPTVTLPLTVQCSLPEGQLFVKSMRGHEELGRLFEYHLELQSRKADLPFAEVLGKPMTIAMTRAGSTIRYFNGIVTALTPTGQKEEFFIFRATLAPKLWMLTRNRDCRVYQGLTIPEVVAEVLNRNVIIFSQKLADDHRKWDYLTQYRESDFAFVSRILEQAGIYYYFKHDAEKHEMVMVDSPTAHEPLVGYDKIPVRAAGTAKVQQDHFTEWRGVYQATAAKITLQDHDFRVRHGSLTNATKGGEAEHELDTMEMYDYPGGYVLEENKDKADVGKMHLAGEHYAMVRLDEQRSDLVRVKAAGNARGIEVGGIIGIATEEKSANTYLVVSTHHELLNAEVRSGALPEGELCQVSLNGLDTRRHFRPARITPKPVIAGPQTAIVVGKKGEEIWTDNFGRVKVQFHWDRQGEENEKSSCWVRVGQIWAGPGWGAMALPRIGNEVIVQFLEGDPDRPLITGSVYNIDNKPPYELPANATQSGIKTRSTKGATAENFNEIRFEDKKGAEELHIQAEKDMTTLVKHDQTITVNNKLTETYKASRTTVVTKADNTTVNDGNKNVTVNKGQYNLIADETVNLKSKKEVFVEVNGTIIHIDPTGTITIKGTMIKLNSG
jgi:type VI secretion system secreted protein VgrG